MTSDMPKSKAKSKSTAPVQHQATKASKPQTEWESSAELERRESQRVDAAITVHLSLLEPCPPPPKTAAATPPRPGPVPKQPEDMQRRDSKKSDSSSNADWMNDLAYNHKEDVAEAAENDVPQLITRASLLRKKEERERQAQSRAQERRIMTEEREEREATERQLEEELDYAEAYEKECYEANKATITSMLKKRTTNANKAIKHLAGTVKSEKWQATAASSAAFDLELDAAEAKLEGVLDNVQAPEILSKSLVSVQDTMYKQYRLTELLEAKLAESCGVDSAKEVWKRQEHRKYADFRTIRMSEMIGDKAEPEKLNTKFKDVDRRFFDFRKEAGQIAADAEYESSSDEGDDDAKMLQEFSSKLLEESVRAQQLEDDNTRKRVMLDKLQLELNKILVASAESDVKIQQVNAESVGIQALLQKGLGKLGHLQEQVEMSRCGLEGLKVSVEDGITERDKLASSHQTDLRYRRELQRDMLVFNAHLQEEINALQLAFSQGPGGKMAELEEYKIKVSKLREQLKSTLKKITTIKEANSSLLQKLETQREAHFEEIEVAKQKIDDLTKVLANFQTKSDRMIAEQETVGEMTGIEGAALKRAGRKSMNLRKPGQKSVAVPVSPRESVKSTKTTKQVTVPVSPKESVKSTKIEKPVTVPVSPRESVKSTKTNKQVTVPVSPRESVKRTKTEKQGHSEGQGVPEKRTSRMKKTPEESAAEGTKKVTVIQKAKPAMPQAEFEVVEVPQAEFEEVEVPQAEFEEVEVPQAEFEVVEVPQAEFEEVEVESSSESDDSPNDMPSALAEANHVTSPTRPQLPTIKDLREMERLEQLATERSQAARDKSKKNSIQEEIALTSLLKSTEKAASEGQKIAKKSLKALSATQAELEATTLKLSHAEKNLVESSVEIDYLKSANSIYADQRLAALEYIQQAEESLLQQEILPNTKSDWLLQAKAMTDEMIAKARKESSELSTSKSAVLIAQQEMLLLKQAQVKETAKNITKEASVSLQALQSDTVAAVEQLTKFKHAEQARCEDATKKEHELDETDGRQGERESRSSPRLSAVSGKLPKDTTAKGSNPAQTSQTPQSPEQPIQSSIMSVSSSASNGPTQEERSKGSGFGAKVKPRKVKGSSFWGKVKPKLRLPVKVMARGVSFRTNQIEREELTTKLATLTEEYQIVEHRCGELRKKLSDQQQHMSEQDYEIQTNVNELESLKHELAGAQFELSLAIKAAEQQESNCDQNDDQKMQEPLERLHFKISRAARTADLKVKAMCSDLGNDKEGRSKMAVFALAQEIMQMVEDGCSLSKVQEALASSSLLVKPPGYSRRYLRSHGNAASNVINTKSSSDDNGAHSEISSQTLDASKPEGRLRGIYTELSRIGISEAEVTKAVTFLQTTYGQSRSTAPDFKLVAGVSARGLRLRDIMQNALNRFDQVHGSKQLCEAVGLFYRERNLGTLQLRGASIASAQLLSSDTNHLPNEPIKPSLDGAPSSVICDTSSDRMIQGNQQNCVQHPMHHPPPALNLHLPARAVQNMRCRDFLGMESLALAIPACDSKLPPQAFRVPVFKRANTMNVRKMSIGSPQTSEKKVTTEIGMRVPLPCRFHRTGMLQRFGDTSRIAQTARTHGVTTPQLSPYNYHRIAFTRDN